MAKIVCSVLAAFISSASFAQSRSNVLETLKHVSDVKTQGQRNTCTIFSTAALLESYYIRKFRDEDIDFSEQWLQYLVSIISETGGGNGSYVTRNFSLIKSYGIAKEENFPYSPKLWSLKNYEREIEKYCPKLKGLNLKRCISSHTHPGFLNASDTAVEKYAGGKNFVLARETANSLKKEFVNSLTGGLVKSEMVVKRLLRKHITLTLELDIFYGAWSTPHADGFGIPRNAQLYKKGVVTYPEPGSLDREISPQHRARHSVQIVGYDDDVVIEYSVAMSDGSIKNFARKGVYYFKNSWGTNNFGSDFKLRVDGRRYSVKGFGMITQDYAHHLGKFFSIDERHYN